MNKRDRVMAVINGQQADKIPSGFNWGIYAQNPSLTEGKTLFPGKVLRGGLDDRSGVLVEGSRSEISAAVHLVLDEMTNTPFILGADCTLPTDIDLSRIKVAVDAVNSYHKQEGTTRWNTACAIKCEQLERASYR